MTNAINSLTKADIHSNFPVTRPIRRSIDLINEMTFVVVATAALTSIAHYGLKTATNRFLYYAVVITISIPLAISITAVSILIFGSYKYVRPVIELEKSLRHYNSTNDPLNKSDTLHVFKCLSYRTNISKMSKVIDKMSLIQLLWIKESVDASTFKKLVNDGSSVPCGFWKDYLNLGINGKTYQAFVNAPAIRRLFDQNFAFSYHFYQSLPIDSPFRNEMGKFLFHPPAPSTIADPITIKFNKESYVVSRSECHQLGGIFGVFFDPETKIENTFEFPTDSLEPSETRFLTILLILLSKQQTPVDISHEDPQIFFKYMDKYICEPCQINNPAIFHMAYHALNGLSNDADLENVLLRFPRVELLQKFYISNILKKPINSETIGDYLRAFQLTRSDELRQKIQTKLNETIQQIGYLAETDTICAIIESDIEVSLAQKETIYDHYQSSWSRMQPSSQVAVFRLFYVVADRISREDPTKQDRKENILNKARRLQEGLQKNLPWQVSDLPADLTFLVDS